MSQYYNGQEVKGTTRIMIYKKSNSLKAEEDKYIQGMNRELWMLEVDISSLNDMVMSINRQLEKSMFKIQESGVSQFQELPDEND